MALLAGERCGQENLDEAGHLFHGVHAPTDRDHVGIVVFAGQHCSLLGPHQGRADAGDLVGRDLLPVAGAADHDSEAGLTLGPALRLIGCHAFCSAQAEDRVVVDRVVDERAVIDGLVAVVDQPAHQVVLEFEAGVVGGEEDGAAGSEDTPDADLYTTPEDMLAVYEALHSLGRFTFAATFGNVHGHYKPGAVKLRPEILKLGQDAVTAKFGAAAEFDLVFHGGSGSSLEEIRETLDYGVVKMNVDTDTQYAFTRPIAEHIFKNYDGILKVDGEIGNKKAYDPRAYLKAAETGMAARISVACDDLLSSGKSIGGQV